MIQNRYHYELTGRHVLAMLESSDMFEQKPDFLQVLDQMAYVNPIPFLAHSYDLVLVCGLGSDQVQALERELWRVLKVGGSLYTASHDDVILSWRGWHKVMWDNLDDWKFIMHDKSVPVDLPFKLGQHDYHAKAIIKRTGRSVGRKPALLEKVNDQIKLYKWPLLDCTLYLRDIMGRVRVITDIGPVEVGVGR